MSAKRILTDEELRYVEMHAHALSIKQMSNFLQIDPDTFYEIKKRDKRLLRAYKKGKSDAINQIASNLAIRALNDNTAAIFYLKTQAGWRENRSYEDEEMPVLIEAGNLEEVAKSHGRLVEAFAKGSISDNNAQSASGMLNNTRESLKDYALDKARGGLVDELLGENNESK